MLKKLASKVPARHGNAPAQQQPHDNEDEDDRASVAYSVAGSVSLRGARSVVRGVVGKVLPGKNQLQQQHFGGENAAPNATTSSAAAVVPPRPSASSATTTTMGMETDSIPDTNPFDALVKETTALRIKLRETTEASERETAELRGRIAELELDLERERENFQDALSAMTGNLASAAPPPPSSATGASSSNDAQVRDLERKLSSACADATRLAQEKRQADARANEAYANVERERQRFAKEREQLESRVAELTAALGAAASGRAVTPPPPAAVPDAVQRQLRELQEENIVLTERLAAAGREFAASFEAAGEDMARLERELAVAETRRSEAEKRANEMLVELARLQATVSVGQRVDEAAARAQRRIEVEKQQRVAVEKATKLLKERKISRAQFDAVYDAARQAVAAVDMA